MTPFVAGSDTSEAAARSVEATAPRDQDRILASVGARHSDGMTCDELEVALGLSHQTASARVRDLVKAGRIIDSGKRRKTRTGRSAAVYVRAVVTVPHES